MTYISDAPTQQVIHNPHASPHARVLGFRAHLLRQRALHVLDLAPQHEGLQDLVQPVDDHHPLLLQPLCAAVVAAAQRLPEPVVEGRLVVEYLEHTQLALLVF